MDGDGLRLMNQLQPLIYEKTKKLYDYGEQRSEDDNDYHIEAGFIAQEVKKIPGPFAPPFRRRPRRKITDRSYS